MVTPTPTTVQVKFQLRIDTAATWTSVNPVLLSGEMGLESDTNKFKIGNGSTAWNSLGYFPFVVSGGTVTGNLEIGTTGTLTFEGSTADGFETTLGVVDPTADRTINLPNVSGTVVTTGDTGTVTSTMIADGTIVNADVSASAAIAHSKLATITAGYVLIGNASGVPTATQVTGDVTISNTGVTAISSGVIVDADVSATAEIAVNKLANGTVNQVLVTDGTDVSWSDDLTIAGNLTVNGTTTTVNTQTLVVEDKNIELGVVGTPTDLTADGGGITLKGTTNKTINWVDATDSWTSSENIDLASGKSYRINGTEVLSGTALGSGVTSSSLTSVGTITAGTWQGTAIAAAYLDSTVVTTGDTGTVTSTMIADGTIINADVSGTAAIAGSKIDPDFGSQTVKTTGVFSAATGSNSAPSITFTGDLNTGIYSPGADQLAISTNGAGRLFVDASGRIGLGVNSPTEEVDIAGDVYMGTGVIKFANNLGIYGYDTSSTIRRLFHLGTDNNLYLNANSLANAQVFQTSNTERLRITSTGQLSHIGGGSSGSPAVGFNGSAPSNSLVIDSTGKVGLGISTPENLLHLRTEVNSAVTHLYLTNRISGASVESRIAFTTSANDLSDNRHAYIGAVTTGAGENGNSFVIATNPTGNSAQTRVFVSSTGNVGIGTASPGYALDIASSDSTANIGYTLRLRANATAAASALQFTNDAGATQSALISATDSTNAEPRVLRFTAAGGFVAGLNTSTEAARIDSSGRLLVGTSSAYALGKGRITQTQVHGLASANASSGLCAWGTAALPELNLARSRGATVGTRAVVNSGDILGDLFYSGDDGTNFIAAASIQAAVDGTPGTNDMPGRIVFSTTADGASSPTERMRIDSGGKVIINGRFYLFNTVGIDVSSGTQDGVSFFENSSANPALQMSTDNKSLIRLRRRSSDGEVMQFRRDTTGVGTISVTTTATAYNTSSDYRLKENVTAVTDGITRLQQLKPSRFNFIADPTKTVDGFLAHEVQDIVPEAITGEKDAVDENGDPQYQGIDQSKLVPLLTAALQEAVAKIESLEARLTAAGI